MRESTGLELLVYTNSSESRMICCKVNEMDSVHEAHTLKNPLCVRVYLVMERALHFAVCSHVCSTSLTVALCGAAFKESGFMCISST